MLQSSGVPATTTALAARQRQLSLDCQMHEAGREIEWVLEMRAIFSFQRKVCLRQWKIEFFTKGHPVHFHQDPKQASDRAERNHSTSQETTGSST